mgnify:CR=1 FL=1
MLIMDIDKYIHNNTIKLKVIPNSSKMELVEDKQLKLYLKAIPDKNKANLELIKFFKKKFNLKVEIKSGIKSRDKVLKLI